MGPCCRLTPPHPHEHICLSSLSSPIKLLRPSQLSSQLIIFPGHHCMQQAMEHLAIESFSYRWLINLKPNSFDFCAGTEHLDEEEDAFSPPPHPFDDLYYYVDQEECFIEMDPKNMGHFKNAPTSAEIQDFNFDVSAATLHPLALVDAEQIFANGLLVPLHHHLMSATSSTMQRRTSLEYCCSPPTSETTHSPLSSSSTMSLLPTPTTLPPPDFLPRCRRYSRRILLTCVRFLRPFCWWVRRRRRRGRGMNMASRRWWATTASPSRMSISSSSSSSSSSTCSTEWGESHIMLAMASEVERSISDAVLHCKRSNGELGS